MMRAVMTQPAILDTGGKKGEIKEEQALGLLVSVASENRGLDSGTICDSLIGVDGLVGLLAVEEVGHELLDTRDTGGTADKDDFVDVRLVDICITEDLLNGESGAGEILAKLFRTRTGNGGVEVDNLEWRVHLNGGLRSRREGTLSMLASGAETTERTST